MKITVFGLDKRFGYAARTLTERGFQTVRYEPESDLSGVLLLPLPASRGGDTVTGYPAVRLSDLLEGKPRAIVGGNLSGSFISAARRAGIAVRDYMNVEAFVLKNACLTAQAALGILLSEPPLALEMPRWAIRLVPELPERESVQTLDESVWIEEILAELPEL